MKQLTFILLIFFCYNGYSQKAPFKFGKIDEEEVAITECDFHPDAHSMILGQYGTINFIYSDLENTLRYKMEVIVRKKIFNKVDKDAGSFKLRYYSPEHGKANEEVTNLKGYTYNIKDGKVEKIKLDNSGKFENRINDYWKEIAVTMPDVQEGSVIEYTYTITSNLFSTLRPWHFQSDIPVKYSEFRVTLPEWYNYQVNNVGTYTKIEHEQSTVSEEFRYSYKTSSGAFSMTNPTAGRSQTNYSSFKSLSTYRRFVARNVKPVIEEPHMNNKVDLPNRVEFQLISVKMPNSPVESIAESYEKFNENLLKRSDFGERLKKGNFAKDQIALLADKSDLEKAASLYGYVKSNMTWNGYSNITSDNAGTQAFNKKEGSVADINLTLVAAYREAGLNAYPVLISTRGHGIPHPVYPSYEEFNHVAAVVIIDNVAYFSDATSNLPFGMLPSSCLNGQGWVTTETGGSWINLKANNKHQSTVMIHTSITPEKVENKISIKEEGYGALSNLSKIEKDGEEKFLESISSNFPEWDLSDFSVGEKSITQGIKYDFTLNKEMDDEDIIYIQPLMIGMDKENPFNREERFSPIDFPYSYFTRVFNSITVPEGYEAELPAPGIIKLPNDGGVFIYNISQVGNTINIMSDLKLTKTDFTPQEYQALKQFFHLMVEKNNSLIVLKKV